MTNTPPREERYACHGKVGLFLTDRNGQNAITKRLHGQLLDISGNGACLSLAEIIIDRKHLAYAPMESDNFKLHIVFYLEEGEFIVAAKTTWFNKKLSEEDLPFRIGMEFFKTISAEQLKKIRST